jgi:hypothetical protein
MSMGVKESMRLAVVGPLALLKRLPHPLLSGIPSGVNNTGNRDTISGTQTPQCL